MKLLKPLLLIVATVLIGTLISSGKLTVNLISNLANSLFWFVVVMSVLVIVHEFAHFLVGKKLGAEPQVFSVGMGKVLYKFNWLGAEFRISALPIGGYVKFKKVQFDGENGKDELNEKIKPSSWIWIALAGPVSNLVLSFLVFGVMSYLAFNKMNVVPIESGVYQLQMTCSSPNNNCSGVPELVNKMIFHQDSAPVIIDFNELKLIKKDQIAALQTSPMSFGEQLRLSVVSSFYVHEFFTKATFNALKGIVVSPKNNYKQVSGPIGIASQLNQTSKLGIEYIWMMFGAISFSLGFMNLLPLSVLDGGRVVLAIYQSTVNNSINISFLNVVNSVSVMGLILLMLVGTFADLGRML